MSAEIKQSLYKEFQIEKDVKFIQELTFEILLNWNSENKIIKLTDSKESSKKIGDLSSLLPEQILVDLKTENSKQKIFFLHSIEGHTNHLTSLAMRLNADVYGLQCTAECKFETIEELALHYEKIIRGKQTEEPYMLCGYSYGALLALEIASILESKGLIVRIICIEGSPDYTKFELKQLFTNLESWNVHEKILMDFAMNHSTKNREEV